MCMHTPGKIVVLIAQEVILTPSVTHGTQLLVSSLHLPKDVPVQVYSLVRLIKSKY